MQILAAVRRSLFVALALGAGLGPLRLAAQEIMLDQMLEAGPLFVFPIYGDERTFYYLPDKIRLGQRSDGTPEFAFIKFVKNVPNASASDRGEAQTQDAGGLVTFTVFLDASETEIAAARRELGRLKPGAQLVGPIAYESGNFVVLSSFLENQRWTEKVVGFGRAPVLPGHKAAVSMELTAEGATILWESFGMPTSQISVGFEMVIEGYRDAYEGSIEVNSRQFASNQRIAAGLKLGSMIGLDIDLAFKELRDSGAIKIVEKGSSTTGPDMLKAAYNKILDNYFVPVSSDPLLMQTLQDDANVYSNFDKAAEFNRTERERVRRENQEDRAEYERRQQEAIARGQRTGEYLPILDLLPLGGAGGGGGNAGPGGPATPSEAFSPPEDEAEPDFSLVGAYRVRTTSIERDFKYEISQYERDTKALRFDQPLGGNEIRSRRNNTSYFLVVNEEDPAYTQRQVHVSIAGQDSKDFERWVNTVVVQLRKRHENGTETFRELIIDRTKFADAFNNYTLLYGNLGARRERNWLNYEYRAIWNLGGGVSWDSGWLASDQGSISIAPPHKYAQVKFSGNTNALEAAQVRSVDVKFSRDFLGRLLTDQLSFEVGGEGPTSQVIEYAYLNGQPSTYQYEVTWRLPGNRSVTTGRQTSDASVITFNELP
jgi:hypothetical protein